MTAALVASSCIISSCYYSIGPLQPIAHTCSIPNRKRVMSTCRAPPSDFKYRLPRVYSYFSTDHSIQLVYYSQSQCRLLSKPNVTAATTSGSGLLSPTSRATSSATATPARSSLAAPTPSTRLSPSLLSRSLLAASPPSTATRVILVRLRSSGILFQYSSTNIIDQETPSTATTAPTARRTSTTTRQSWARTPSLPALESPPMLARSSLSLRRSTARTSSTGSPRLPRPSTSSLRHRWLALEHDNGFMDNEHERKRRVRCRYNSGNIYNIEILNSSYVSIHHWFLVIVLATKLLLVCNGLGLQELLQAPLSIEATLELLLVCVLLFEWQ